MLKADPQIQEVSILPPKNKLDLSAKKVLCFLIIIPKSILRMFPYSKK